MVYAPFCAFSSQIIAQKSTTTKTQLTKALCVIMSEPDSLEKKLRFVFGLLVMFAVSSVISFFIFLGYEVVHFTFCLILGVLFAFFAVYKGDEAYEKLRYWLGWW